MEIAGNCNLLITEGVRCRENEECAVCGMCTKHCLEHFQLMTGVAHGRTVAPVKVTRVVEFRISSAAGMFTAAGICYSQMELDAFADKDDNRPKRWFLTPIEKLKTVSNVEQYLTKKLAQTPR